MTSLDVDGRRLLEDYQRLEGAAALRAVPDASGSDPTGALMLVVDAARRVRQVRLAEDHRLTEPRTFAKAVVAAYAAADGARGVASLEASGQTAEWVREAEELRSGLRTLDRGHRPGVRRPAARAATASYLSLGLTRGTSANGYLEITRDKHGDVVDVTADPAWLAGARTHHVERALRQAFDTDRSTS